MGKYIHRVIGLKAKKDYNRMEVIFVFKTSVNTEELAEQLASGLNDLLKQSNWNFDLEDCDKILRIESDTEIAEDVIKHLRDQGFDCEELPD